MPPSNLPILYVDQSAQLAGGELNLYDYLRFSTDPGAVVLLEDGPFRLLLEQLGIPVTVLPLGDVDGIRRESGLRVVLRAIPIALSLRRRLLALTDSSDIVYANSQKAFLLSVVSRRRRQPLIWHLHDMLVPEHFSRLLRMIAVFAGNRFASMIIVNSQATASAFLTQGGRSDKVRIVYCGLDPTSFDAVGPETAAALRARICPPECYLVGIFGRLAEWKGQHVLLEAVSALPQVHIAVVGDALFGEDTYKSRLMDRAQQPDLVNRIHFLGFRENIAELMKCVDLIAHTSVAPEPFGRVIVEGMLARKPIIASNGGGAAEIIQNGRSGLLTQPGSVEELRSAIVRVHADSVLASRLAVEARLRAEELFLLSGMVEGIQTLIAEVRHRGKHG